MSLFKIRNSAGLYSTGTSTPRWTSKGKTWNSIGALKLHLRIFDTIPLDWRVVEFELVEKPSTPARIIFNQVKEEQIKKQQDARAREDKRREDEEREEYLKLKAKFEPVPDGMREVRPGLYVDKKSTSIFMRQEPSKYFAYAIEWTEYERGWGQRGDGVSLHLSEADALNFSKKVVETDAALYKDHYGSGVPDCYSRPDMPKLIQVKPEHHKRLLEKGDFWLDNIKVLSQYKL